MRPGHSSHAAPTDADLAKAAWDEWLTGLSYGGISEELHALRDPPRWFVLVELGYGVGHGPSLSETCADLERRNRAAVLSLDPEDVPYHVTYPLDFALAPRSAPQRRPAREPSATAALIERLRIRLGIGEST